MGAPYLEGESISPTHDRGQPDFHTIEGRVLLPPNNATASGGKTLLYLVFSSKKQNAELQNAGRRTHHRVVTLAQIRLRQLVLVQYAALKYSKYGLTHIDMARSQSSR